MAFDMAFEHELCVLFLYHKCDDVTTSHLDSLRRSNPRLPILPVTDSVIDHLPDSVDVGVFPDRRFCSQKWRSIDTTLYRWFLNRRFDARRYLVVEYDCLCTVDLMEFYAPVLRADVAGVDFFTLDDNPGWWWFKRDELDNLPSTDRSHAAGLVPFTCSMFSHNALETIVANVCSQDVFCELRLGTAIKKTGLQFIRLPLQQRRSISWHVYPWRVDRPGIFHSIKSLEHNKRRWSSPGSIGCHLHDRFRAMNSQRVFWPVYFRGICRRRKHNLRM
jgi:hypothetical protein